MCNILSRDGMMHFVWNINIISFYYTVGDLSTEGCVDWKIDGGTEGPPRNVNRMDSIEREYSRRKAIRRGELHTRKESDSSKKRRTVPRKNVPRMESAKSHSILPLRNRK
jgi:hypothetical protein